MNNDHDIKEYTEVSPTSLGRARWGGALLGGLGSGKLALALIVLLILFSLVGAVLPQESQLSLAEFSTWQAEHPQATEIVAPLGWFDVFHSWPFLGTIAMLTLNILTCTALRWRRQGGVRSLTGPGAAERAGFVVLHLSLILLFAGGLWSAAADLDGKVILTEGQRFIDAPENYYRLLKGPLRGESHTGMAVELQSVDIQYLNQRRTMTVSSKLKAVGIDGEEAAGAVEINYPFNFQGLSFTHDETGYSPRLEIRDAARGRILVDSFIALKTKKTVQGREYRDFLPLPFLKQRIVVTLFPNYAQEDDQLRSLGDAPQGPLLLLEIQDESGKVVRSAELELGERIVLGRHTFAFTDLRRWASFRVGHDPGYPLVCVALWIGLAALIMRYLPDLRTWLYEWAPDRSGPPAFCRVPQVVPQIAGSSVTNAGGSCDDRRIKR